MKDWKELITITVPVYNVEKYLRDCLDSIITQSYKNIEIILVNDGSTDASLSICKDYEYDSRIKIIDKDNEGLSSARQVGLDAAKGSYICFVDSDDYLSMNYIEKMYCKIKEKNADVCVCGSKFIADNYEVYHGLNTKELDGKQISKKIIEDDYFKDLYNYYMSDSWNKMFRISFVRGSRVKFSLPKEFNGTDLSFNHRLLLHGPKFAVIDEPLYIHRLLNNSRVRRKNKQLQKGFEIIMNQIIEESEKFNFSPKFDIQLNTLYIKFLKEATQDLYNNAINYSDFINELNQLKNDNNEFLINHREINTKPRYVASLPLKLFSLCVNSRNNTRILAFLKLREYKLLVKDHLKDFKLSVK